jgi:hypothetical protein
MAINKAKNMRLDKYQCVSGRGTHCICFFCPRYRPLEEGFLEFNAELSATFTDMHWLYCT